jgi:hypothetical protein
MTSSSPLVVKVRRNATYALKCEHCGERAKWSHTSKLIHCDWPGHPVGRNRANDHGVWGCWLCPLCAEPFPVAPTADTPPKLTQDDTLF